MNAPFKSVYACALLAACLLLNASAFAGLQPFPFKAGQTGTVTCLENPAISYTVYLPPNYLTNGTPLPILYTMSPGGGGMTSTFETHGVSLGMIIVGLVNVADGVSWDTILRDFYAVPLDIRQRVLFDPSGVYAGGFSGGGECSYVFARFWPQQVTGILAMGGWMGRGLPTPATAYYYSTDRVQTNLLVARTTGTTDAAAQQNIPYDSNYLSACGAVVQDWSFVGGHEVPTTLVLAKSLEWLLGQRTRAGANDQSNSMILACNWRAQISGGSGSAVLADCLATMMNQPRTWNALEAQLVLDDLMTNYNTFRELDVSALFPASSAFTTNNFGVSGGGWINYWSTSDFASDLFYYSARGAADNNAWPQYHACLKAMNGVAGVNGDRYGDLFNLLVAKGYPAPILQISAGPASSQVDVWLQEDTGSLQYNLQNMPDLTTGSWSGVEAPAVETNTLWSATVDLDPNSAEGFFQVQTMPVSLGISPPFPD